MTTISALIKHLEGGAGWVNGYIPRLAGKALARLGLDAATPCTVVARVWHYGSGASSRSESFWEVKVEPEALTNVRARDIIGTAAFFGGRPDLEVEVREREGVVRLTHRRP